MADYACERSEVWEEAGTNERGNTRRYRGRLNEDETDQTPAKAAGEQKRNMKAREQQVLRNVGMVPPCCRREHQIYKNHLTYSPRVDLSLEWYPRNGDLPIRWLSGPNANFQKRGRSRGEWGRLVDLRDLSEMFTLRSSLSSVVFAERRCGVYCQSGRLCLSLAANFQKLGRSRGQWGPIT